MPNAGLVLVLWVGKKGFSSEPQSQQRVPCTAPATTALHTPKTRPYTHATYMHKHKATIILLPADCRSAVMSGGGGGHSHDGAACDGGCAALPIYSIVGLYSPLVHLISPLPPQHAHRRPTSPPDVALSLLASCVLLLSAPVCSSFGRYEESCRCRRLSSVLLLARSPAPPALPITPVAH